ncbi:MAG: hypothetical protein IJT94_02330, partial [Oscillibacter sp.]|nr:hypothetical protein [Oscillibacter sp.]
MNDGAKRAKEIFLRWLDGEMDLMASLPDASEGHDLPRKHRRDLEDAAVRDAAKRMEWVGPAVKRFERTGYRVLASLCCFALMCVFLYMAAHITRFGDENPRATEVARRYVEEGLEETGATNMVAG